LIEQQQPAEHAGVDSETRDARPGGLGAFARYW
jgi:hypothetical protein